MQDIRKGIANVARAYIKKTYTGVREIQIGRITQSGPRHGLNLCSLNGRVTQPKTRRRSIEVGPLILESVIKFG